MLLTVFYIPYAILHTLHTVNYKVYIAHYIFPSQHGMYHYTLVYINISYYLVKYLSTPIKNLAD